MKLEFIPCDLPCNHDSLREIQKLSSSNYVFVLYELTEKHFDYKMYKDVTTVTKKIGRLNIHTNVTVFNGDFFRPYNEIRFKGYCPIEAPEDLPINF